MAKKGIIGEKLTNIALNMAFRCVFRRKIFKCKENMSPLPPQKFLSLGGGAMYLCYKTSTGFSI